MILKKLMFLHHLSQLSDVTLAKQIYNIQKEKSLPGLVEECSNILSTMGIQHEPSLYTKVQWKRMIYSKVHEKNKDDILTQIKSYKKLVHEKILCEEYGEKSYLKTMNVKNARTFFAYRAQTLSTAQMNFKHKPEYVLNKWKCSCGEDDYQSHLPHCLSYEHLREGLNLEDSDHDLVLFFQRVIREREREDDRDADSQTLSEGVNDGEIVHSRVGLVESSRARDGDTLARE